MSVILNFNLSYKASVVRSVLSLFDPSLSFQYGQTNDGTYKILKGNELRRDNLVASAGFPHSEIIRSDVNGNTVSTPLTVPINLPSNSYVVNTPSRVYNSPQQLDSNSVLQINTSLAQLEPGFSRLQVSYQYYDQTNNTFHDISEFFDCPFYEGWNITARELNNIVDYVEGGIAFLQKEIDIIGQEVKFALSHEFWRGTSVSGQVSSISATQGLLTGALTRDEFAHDLGAKSIDLQYQPLFSDFKSVAFSAGSSNINLHQVSSAPEIGRDTTSDNTPQPYGFYLSEAVDGNGDRCIVLVCATRWGGSSNGAISIRNDFTSSVGSVDRTIAYTSNKVYSHVTGMGGSTDSSIGGDNSLIAMNPKVSTVYPKEMNISTNPSPNSDTLGSYTRVYEEYPWRSSNHIPYDGVRFIGFIGGYAPLWLKGHQGDGGLANLHDGPSVNNNGNFSPPTSGSTNQDATGIVQSGWTGMAGGIWDTVNIQGQNHPRLVFYPDDSVTTLTINPITMSVLSSSAYALGGSGNNNLVKDLTLAGSRVNGQVISNPLLPASLQLITVSAAGPFTLSALDKTSYCQNSFVTINGSGVGGGGHLLYDSNSRFTLNNSPITPTKNGPNSYIISTANYSPGSYTLVQTNTNGQYSQSLQFNIIGAPLVANVSPPQQHVGGTIVIAGSSFGPSPITGAIAGVTIGGLGCIISAWSDTSITATVPDGVSLGSTQLLVRSNCGASAPIQFAIAYPSKVIIVPHYKVVSVGANFQFTASFASFGGVSPHSMNQFEPILGNTCAPLVTNVLALFSEAQKNISDVTVSPMRDSAIHGIQFPGDTAGHQGLIPASVLYQAVSLPGNGNLGKTPTANFVYGYVDNGSPDAEPKYRYTWIVTQNTDNTLTLMCFDEIIFATGAGADSHPNWQANNASATTSRRVKFDHILTSGSISGQSFGGVSNAKSQNSSDLQYHPSTDGSIANISQAKADSVPIWYNNSGIHDQPYNGLFAVARWIFDALPQGTTLNVTGFEGNVSTDNLNNSATNYNALPLSLTVAPPPVPQAGPPNFQLSAQPPRGCVGSLLTFVAVAGSHSQNNPPFDKNTVATVNGQAVNLFYGSPVNYDVYYAQIPSGITGNITFTQTNQGYSPVSAFFIVYNTPHLDIITPTAISTGTQITLTGSNFEPYISGTSKILIDGVNCNINSWSDTQIVLTVPGGIHYGSESLTIVTPYCGSFIRKGVLDNPAVPLDITNSIDTTWFVNGLVGGELIHGSVSQGGLYTAPGAIPPDAIKVSITYYDRQDGNVFLGDSATVVLQAAPTLIITPANINLNGGVTQQFTTSLMYDNITPAQDVTSLVSYSVNGTPGGTTTDGIINSSGLYTAPNTLSVNTEEDITATYNYNNIILTAIAKVIVAQAPTDHASITVKSQINVLLGDGRFGYVPVGTQFVAYPNQYMYVQFQEKLDKNTHLPIPTYLPVQQLSIIVKNALDSDISNAMYNQSDIVVQNDGTANTLRTVLLGIIDPSDGRFHSMWDIGNPVETVVMGGGHSFDAKNLIVSAEKLPAFEGDNAPFKGTIMEYINDLSGGAQKQLNALNNKSNIMVVGNCSYDEKTHIFKIIDSIHILSVMDGNSYGIIGSLPAQEIALNPNEYLYVDSNNNLHVGKFGDIFLESQNTKTIIIGSVLDRFYTTWPLLSMLDVDISGVQDLGKNSFMNIGPLTIQWGLTESFSIDKKSIKIEHVSFDKHFEKSLVVITQPYDSSGGFVVSQSDDVKVDGFYIKIANTGSSKVTSKITWIAIGM